MPGSGQRFYEDDEAEHILRRAASLSSSDGRMTYERLLETAAELGIPPEAVEAAEKEFTYERRERALMVEFDRKQKQGFWYHAMSFAGINLGLVFLNLATSRDYLWFFWPLIGMSIGLISHARGVFMRSSESYQEEFAKWKAVRERRAQGLDTPDEGPNVVVGVHMSRGLHHDRRLEEKLDRAKRKLERIEQRIR